MAIPHALPGQPIDVLPLGERVASEPSVALFKSQQLEVIRLVLPAGTYKVRANDTDYRFRPDTAHTYFSGNQTSDAVLVIEGGESVLYARPRSERDTDEFFRDRQYGELWAGRRPSAQEISDSLGIEVRHVKDLPSFDDNRKTRDVTTDEDLARVAREASRSTHALLLQLEDRLARSRGEIVILEKDLLAALDRVLELTTAAAGRR